jgi:hypothetical protein
MERELSPAAERKLMLRAPLPVDSRRSIAIKRDVHEYWIEADADLFVDAFRRVIADPQGLFGLIRVKRPAGRMGIDFEPGERFQGCYSIEEALKRRFSGSRHQARVARLLAFWPIRKAMGWVEDRLLSDYAMIEQLVLSPDASRGEIHTLRYCYLEGTPIAGSTTYFVESRAGHKCLLRQVLEYQEINGLALAVFQRVTLKMHDQVVHVQIQKAAERAGIPSPVGTIPVGYT